MTKTLHNILRIALVVAAMMMTGKAWGQNLTEYTVSKSNTTYSSIASDDNRLANVSGDGGTQTITLPFNFPFGESIYSSVTVRSDGYLYFPGSTSGHYVYNAWTATNWYAIVPFLADDGNLVSDGSTSGAYKATQIIDGVQTFVIEFKGLKKYSNYGDYNFQVRLYANGNISTVYNTSTLYASANKHNFFLVNGSDKVCLTGSYASPTAGTPSTLPNFTVAPASGTVITYVRPVISCPKPTNLSVSNITTTSATISWDGDADSYQCSCVLSGNDPNWGSNYWTISTTNPYSNAAINGPQPNTEYDFYVRAKCGNEYSDPAMITFRTACEAITTFPWTETFESYASGNFTAPCWVNEHIVSVSNRTDVFQVYTSSNGTNSTHQLKLPDMQSGNMTKLVLPEMNFGGVAHQFLIDVYRNATSYAEEGIRIFASEDGEIEGATELAFISRNYSTAYGNLILAESVSGWYTYELNIPITGTCYIIIRGESQWGSATYMDNFQVKVAPTCPKPTNLTVSNITANSAKLAWDAGGSETSWQYLCADHGFTPNWSGANVITSTTHSNVPANINSGTGNSVLPNTEYDFYVRADCGGGDYSEPVMITFTTACGSYAIPYTYGFEDESPSPFACWTVVSGNITRQSYTANTGSYRLDFRGTTSNMIALPQFTSATNTLRVEFWTRPESTGGNSGKFAVGYMTDINDASTFVAVDTYNSTEMTTSYVKKTVDFTNAPAGANIAMRQFDCSTNYYWYVDDVTVTLAPTCPRPTGLTIASVSATGATITWDRLTTPGTGETITYCTECVPHGETPLLTCTEMSFDRGTWEAGRVPTSYPSSLSPNTEYDFYVYRNCGGGDYSEPVMITFRTACDAYTVTAGSPYTENFNSYSGNSTSITAPTSPAYPNHTMPDCWRFVNMSANTSSYPQMFLTNSSTYAVDGNYLFFKSSSSTPAYAVLPAFTNNIENLVLKFTYRNGGTGTYNGTLHVGISNNLSDLENSYIEVESFAQITTLSEEEIIFASATSERGNYYIVFKYVGGSSNNYYLSIDDVEVSLAPSCIIPGGLNDDDVAATSASLEWNGIGDSYNIRYHVPEHVDGLYEEFGTSIPTGWENKSGLLSNIMSGTAFGSSSQWVFGTNNGVFDNHARINIYGSSRYGWLITPEITIGSDYDIKFDLALTAYSGTGAASGTCDDDRFVVLIYADNAWTILREWNNSGSADVYNNIPLAGHNETIDISSYNGQSVKIAFYGESTVGSNGDNNLHIDNVQIGKFVAATAWQTQVVNSETTTITGLSPNTTYEWQVQSRCDGSSTSEWSSLETFTTTNALPSYTITATANPAEGGTVTFMAGPANSNTSNTHIPLDSYRDNSFSQQIYTPEEVGGGTINSISLFSVDGNLNDGVDYTRTLAVYLAHTNKSEFSSTTDWISNSDSPDMVMVYSGSVTFNCGEWNTINFTTSFTYDGIRNLVLVISDNSGYSEVAGDYLDCKTFTPSSGGNCSLNYGWGQFNPSNPSGNGELLTVKNQLLINGSPRTFPQGASCTLVATANANYNFDNWTEGSTELSTNVAYTINNITADHAIVGNFSLPTFTLTTSVNPTGGGTITCSPTSANGVYTYGTVVTLTANAASGYTFQNWTVDGVTVNGSSTSVTMTANHNVVANFTINTYTVTYNANGGSGTMSSNSYNYNSSVTVMANGFTAPSCKQFSGWQDGNGTSYTVGSTFNMPANNVTLYAQWEDIPQTLSISGAPASGLVCTNSETALTAITGAPSPTYTWSAPSGAGLTYSSSMATVKPTAVGTYTIVCSVAHSCGTLTESVTLEARQGATIGDFPASDFSNCGEYEIHPTISDAACSDVSWYWGSESPTSGDPTQRQITETGAYTFTVTKSTLKQYDMITQNGVAAIVVEVPTATTTGTAVPIGTSGIGSSNESAGSVADNALDNLQEAIKVNGGETYSGSSREGFVIPAGAAGGVCVSTASVNVTINSVPEVSITTPSAICADNPLTLDSPSITEHGSSVTSQEWQISSNGGSSYSSFDPSTQLTSDNNGNLIRYFAQSDCGDGYSDPVTITVNPIPTPTITQANNYIELTCTRTSIELTANGNGGTFNWTGPATGTGNTLSVNSEGTYYVTETKNNCPGTSTGYTITTNTTIPTVSVTGTNEICLGESTTLQTTSNANYTYLWSNSVTTYNNPVTPTATTTYTVTTTDSRNNCSTSDSRIVTVNTPPSSLSSYDYIWKGGTAGHLTDWNTTSNWYEYDRGYLVARSLPETNKNIYIGSADCVNTTTVQLSNTANAKNLTIGTGGSITVPSGKTLNIAGNLDNVGGANVITGDGVVAFCGPSSNGGDQRITHDITLGNVTFNNQGGNILPAGSVTITGDATFTKGVVDADVTFNAGATATANGYNSFVARKVTKKTSTSAETNFVFPTGSAGDGQPKVLGSIKVASLAANSTTEVTFHQKSADNGDGTHGFTLAEYPRWWNINDMCPGTNELPQFDHVSNYEYWTINTALSGLTLTVDAASDLAHFHNPSNREAANIKAAARYDCWKNLGGSASIDGGKITVSGVNVPSSITRGDVNFAGIVTLGSRSSEVVLPIELTSFTATCDGKSALVEWTTATERNNDYFILERSDNAIEFTEITRVAGAGNSIEQLNYSYTDYGVHGGDNYYRLVQVDYDGTRTMTDIVVANCVEMATDDPDVLAYPNPFNDDITVVLDNFGNRPARIEVYDVLGKLIMYKKVDSPQNSYEMMLHLGNLPPAAYNIRVSTADFVINRKVVKQ